MPSGRQRSPTRLPPGNCRVCGRTLTFHQSRAGGLCADWRCREEALGGELRRERERAAEREGLADFRSYPLRVVPHREAPLEPLPAERRTAFAEYLRAVVEGSFEEEPEVGPAPLPEPDPGPAILGRICGACGGACCFRGGPDHAYLDRDAIRRYRAGHPGATADEILADYLSRIPAEGYTGSCVFHGARGCVLPRRIRASICNDYECRALKEARLEHEEGGTDRACVIRREDHVIRGSTFVRGEEE